MKKLVLASIALLLATGCARDKGWDVFKPTEEFEKVVSSTDDIPEPVARTYPKVDILFVIDDSFSMIDEIGTLSSNIPLFVREFTKTNHIDFHIGVTTIWDTIRYQDAAINPNAPVAQFRTETIDGEDVQVRNFWSKGELLPLVKDFTSIGTPNSYVEGPRYVTATTENLEQTLINTLLLKPVQHVPGRDANGDYVAGAGVGPEFEELFSPVKEAFTNPSLNNPNTGANAGFSREGAHKVVVFLTDADDLSQNLTASQLDAMFINLTKDASREQFSTYAVMYNKGGKTSSTCGYDPDLAKSNYRAVKLEEFMALSGGADNMYSICDDFASKLAEMGQKIVRETLKTVVIPMNRYPEYLPSTNETQGIEGAEYLNNWLKVVYGDLVIPPMKTLEQHEADLEKLVETLTSNGQLDQYNLPVLPELTDENRYDEYGWTWDFDSNQILVRGAHLIPAQDNAEFQVLFTAINRNNFVRGGVKKR